MALTDTDSAEIRPVSLVSSSGDHPPSLYENAVDSSCPNGLRSPEDDTGLNETEKALKQAERERHAIVKKYDFGREPGAQIDPWEDPGFEIYHTTDRYGFIHDTRLPDYDPKDLKLRDVEVQREKKWWKMLMEWNKYESTEKLHKRIYKGIPNSLRGRVWAQLLNVPKLQQEQKNKYEEMKTLARKWSPDIRQIDLDVNRTYRDHVSFRDRYGIQQKNLFHVLGAYSMYNQEIGYCQGMSQIAALLLMYMEEEEAFWALSALMADRRYAMHGFFISGFPKLLRFKDYHSKILSKFLPKLKIHLDKNCVDPLIYGLKWFFQCFLDRVPFSLTLRLWDVYLLEGECILNANAYNILKLHRRTLMKLGMDEILGFLQTKLEKDFGFDDDHVIASLSKCMEELKKAKLLYFGPPPPDELPKKPFGLYVEPPLSQKIGRRTNFTEEERRIKEDLIRRQDKELMEGLKVESQRAAANRERRGSNAGSQGSHEPSIDEVSSLGNYQRHRNSMSSVTATSASFSVHSSHTLSQSQQFLVFSHTPPRKRLGGAQSDGNLQHENGDDRSPARNGPSGNGLPSGVRSSPYSNMRGRGGSRGNRGISASPKPQLKLDLTSGGELNIPVEIGEETPISKSPRTFPNTPDTVRIYVHYQEPLPSATSTPKAHTPSRENGDVSRELPRRPVSTSPTNGLRSSRKEFFEPLSSPVPGRKRQTSPNMAPSSAGSYRHQNYQPVEDPNRVTIRVDPRDSVSWPSANLGSRENSISHTPGVNPSLSNSAPPFGAGGLRPKIPIRATEPR